MSGADATLARWRLVLGRYADERMPGALDRGHVRIEEALDFLYAREYAGRGVREGDLGPSRLAIPAWLSEIRELFPREAIATIEKHALGRYGLTELVTDPEILARIEPSTDLLKLLLTFRGHLKADMLQQVRRIVRHVVEEITRRIAPDVRRAMAGRLDRFRRSPLRVARNLDWRGTIRSNLKHYDRARGKLAVERLLFFSRVQRRLPWTVILCVDQSGSMAGSVIHSAVMAGILAGLPMVRVRLVVFDTAVVDLSDHVADPVEALMSVQLGGGTHIGRAMRYCEQLVEMPHRTILVLISDFCEGAPPGELLSCCRRLREAGVRLIGLAALDETAAAAHDTAMAERLAEAGMDIAALTPKRLAEWLARIIS